MPSGYDIFFRFFFWLCTTSISKIVIKLTFIVHVFTCIFKSYV